MLRVCTNCVIKDYCKGGGNERREGGNGDRYGKRVEGRKDERSEEMS